MNYEQAGIKNIIINIGVNFIASFRIIYSCNGINKCIGKVLRCT